jgi:hypothetical protein
MEPEFKYIGLIFISALILEFMTKRDNSKTTIISGFWYIYLIPISGMILELSRRRAGSLDPFTNIIFPVLVWPLGLPLGTIDFVTKGLSRERNQEIEGSGEFSLFDYNMTMISLIIPYILITSLF